jgi:CRP-like cAMP-binding protein
MKLEALDDVRDSAFFKGLEDGDLALLAESFQAKELQEGTTVFIENMPGETLYLIKSGAVRITKMMAEGEDRIVLVLGPEEIFGELSIIAGGQRTSTARVAESGTLLSLSRRDFDTLCDRHPRLGIKLVRNIAEVFSRRVRESEQDYYDMLRWAMHRNPSPKENR